jgi:PadR family transcriptional regulator, regulatory protein PadR
MLDGLAQKTLLLQRSREGANFGMLEELGRQGYRISPGTLYPILHSLEQKGYLRSRERRDGKSLRKIYCATSKGRKALEASKDKIRELFHEVVERH